MKKRSIFLSPFLLLVASTAVNAQWNTSSYTGAWSTTWNNPSSSLASVMIQGYINKKMLERSIANQRAGKQGQPASAGRTAAPAAVRSETPRPTANYSTLRFKPVANSGVAKQTADALTKDPKERAELLGLFQEIKKSYDAEASKSGKSNNVAAALTFFMATTSMVYHQSDEPAESVTDALLEIMQQDMSTKPEFKSMTALEKQKMHDWLVISGGFVLAGYLDAVQKNDQSQLSDYKQLADEIFKIVLGTSAENFNLATIGTGGQ